MRFHSINKDNPHNALPSDLSVPGSIHVDTGEVKQIRLFEMGQAGGRVLQCSNINVNNIYAFYI